MSEPNADPLVWMSAREMANQGLRAAGPELDCGMRWGDGENIRVSFAPLRDGRGYLYAHDRIRDQYAVLSAETTREAVDAAWQIVSSRPLQPKGYLALADLASVREPLEVEDARALWSHCVERELEARRDHENAGSDPGRRFKAARAVVVSQMARVATEELLVEALSSRACEFGAPAVVRYRIVDRAGWSGRVAGADLPDAAFRTADLQKLAGRFGYDVQATSLSHGHVVVSAARVPELEFAAGPLALGPSSTIPF